MTGLSRARGLTDPVGWSGWTGPSSDPRDEQFGDVVSDAALADAAGFDVVLVGEPYDGAVLGRPGAREGPAALRAALAAAKTHHFEAGPVATAEGTGDAIDGGDDGGGVDGAAHRIADLGDVSVLANRPGAADVAAIQERVAEVTRAVHETDALPVFLGGDNSLTVPNVTPLLERGSVGVVNVDAHLDVRAVRETPSSGTPYRQLFEAGLDAYACVGARHFETSTAYADFVRERGGDVVTADAACADPVAAADRALDALSGVDRVYVSVDLDALDANAAPGVSAPTPGGLTSRALFQLLRRVAADPRVAGFEVVECAPAHDRDGMTATAGGRAIAHFLGGLEGRDE